MIEIREEFRQLGSRDLQQNLLYPGNWLFRWIKFNHMPWQLLEMSPALATIGTPLEEGK